MELIIGPASARVDRRLPLLWSCGIAVNASRGTESSREGGEEGRLPLSGL